MSETLTVATWNVNSIKMRLGHVLDWLAVAKPDVLALQELKAVDEAFPFAEFEAAGWHALVHGQKTYNGVALLSRVPGADPRRGPLFVAGDEQARAVSAVFGGVRVYSLYVPNGSEVGSDKYAYKLAWLDGLAAHLAAAHRPDERLVLVGDFNIAPADIDTHDPAFWNDQQILTSTAERAALQRLLDWGLVDVFRRLHPGEGKLYSWWDYRNLALPKNLGLRIDLVLATAPLAAQATACTIDKAPRKRKDKPSDHTPVVATFAL